MSDTEHLYSDIKNLVKRLGETERERDAFKEERDALKSSLTFGQLRDLPDGSEIWRAGRTYRVTQKPDKSLTLEQQGGIVLPHDFSRAALGLMENQYTGFVMAPGDGWEYS